MALLTRYCSKPKISFYNLDITRSWFIHFRYFDHTKKKWVLIRRSKGLNRIKEVEVRLAEFKALQRQIVLSLKNGWNPISDLDWDITDLLKKVSKKLLSGDATREEQYLYYFTK